jgi:UDP-3-O-[3-hydroxymyristoyl] glucosamine N-acyltransferase
VVGHIRIGKDVKIGAKSGVHSSILDGRIVSGIPTMPYETFLKTMAALKHLPKIREKVRKLEKEVQSLAEAARPGNTIEGKKQESGNDTSQ